MTMSFLIALFFVGVPFAMYMTLRSQNTGAMPITYSHLVQIYAYSLFCFIPTGFLYTIFWPYSRFRFFLLSGAVTCSCYYQYKETLEVGRKYLTYNVFKRLAAGTITSTVLFALLIKVYFIA